MSSIDPVIGSYLSIPSVDPPSSCLQRLCREPGIAQRSPPSNSTGGVRWGRQAQGAPRLSSACVDASFVIPSYDALTGASIMRINARPDDEHSEKLRYLASITGANVSEILKQAIDLYYQRQRLERRDPRTILEESGFIGVAEAGEDLSSSYKAALESELCVKHADR